MYFQKNIFFLFCCKFSIAALRFCLDNDPLSLHTCSLLLLIYICNVGVFQGERFDYIQRYKSFSFLMKRLCESFCEVIAVRSSGILKGLFMYLLQRRRSCHINSYLEKVRTIREILIFRGSLSQLVSNRVSNKRQKE